MQSNHLEVSQLSLGEEQLKKVTALDRLALERSRRPVELDAIARNDREDEAEEWLKLQGLDDAWGISASLVSVGLDQSELADLSQLFAAPLLRPVLDRLSVTYTIYRMLFEIGLSAGRIAVIVNALKDYSYLDRAPIQSVKVHDALDNTLIVLQNRLGDGVAVLREYADELPVIVAHGGELNQVWTNLIDNAVGAMAGEGRLIVRTRAEDQWVVVEIEDDGPGIPEDDQSKVFDPFFTTKPPGAGTGLGLSTCHNIVQKHRGQIEVSSQPGRTCFSVRLPLDAGPTA